MPAEHRIGAKVRDLFETVLGFQGDYGHLASMASNGVPVLPTDSEGICAYWLPTGNFGTFTTGEAGT